MEVASELSLEGQRNQTLKDEAGRAFQREGTAWAKGGRWEGTQSVEEKAPTSMARVRGPPRARQASGAGSQRHRDLLQRRECTEWGISGTVATLWMISEEEWVLPSPLECDGRAHRGSAQPHGDRAVRSSSEASAQSLITVTPPCGCDRQGFQRGRHSLPLPPGA